MPEAQKPSIGRVVHYVLAPHDLPADKQHCVGEERPAVIVRVWGNDEHSGVNLQVFVDGGNDGFKDGTYWKTSVLPSSGPVPGCWHWPERS